LPIYEYECTHCSNRFEQRQRFEEEPVAICPVCSGKARRVIHSVPIVFKGSGFYCTDHGRTLRNQPSHVDEEKEAKEKEKPKVATEAKADTKTETKSGEND